MSENLGSRKYGKVLSITLVLLTLFVLCIAYLYWSSRPDPRFTLANLHGLTPDQVIAKLGPPTTDPRAPSWGWQRWTPDNPYGAPLALGYKSGVIFDGGKWNWTGLCYGVTFKDNQVVKVSVGHN